MANELVSYLLHCDWYIILLYQRFSPFYMPWTLNTNTSEYLDGITLNSCISIQELIIFPILSIFYNKYR